MSRRCIATLRQSRGRGLPGVTVALLLTAIPPLTNADAGGVPSATIAIEHRTVDRELADALVRKIITAIENANSTGNFSVLHALGSSEYRRVLSVQDIAQSLAPLRESNINLISALLPEPRYQRPLAVGQDHSLLLVGYLRTQPLWTRFSFRFVWEEGNWRILDLAVAAEAPSAMDEVDDNLISMEPYRASAEPLAARRSRVPPASSDW